MRTAARRQGSRQQTQQHRKGRSRAGTSLCHPRLDVFVQEERRRGRHEEHRAAALEQLRPQHRERAAAVGHLGASLPPAAATGLGEPRLQRTGQRRSVREQRLEPLSLAPGHVLPRYAQGPSGGLVEERLRATGGTGASRAHHCRTRRCTAAATAGGGGGQRIKQGIQVARGRGQDLEAPAEAVSQEPRGLGKQADAVGLAGHEVRLGQHKLQSRLCLCSRHLTCEARQLFQPLQQPI
mmetsp:Transcript_101706/g.283178  ORF Transcript_101706/g.283178 Transcript_101706/m.283178 type:complete len:238 (-) Transcript_101706:606-1319(-)